jgi:hypothetical protein
LREDLSHAGVASVAETEVYGLAGIVRLRDDTVFVARFRGGWKVSAAGCVPATGRSFHCQVKGQ